MHGFKLSDTSSIELGSQGQSPYSAASDILCQGMISFAGPRAGTELSPVTAFRTCRGRIAVSMPFFLTAAHRAYSLIYHSSMPCIFSAKWWTSNIAIAGTRRHRLMA